MEIRPGNDSGSNLSTLGLLTHNLLLAPTSDVPLVWTPLPDLANPARFSRPANGADARARLAKNTASFRLPYLVSGGSLIALYSYVHPGTGVAMGVSLAALLARVHGVWRVPPLTIGESSFTGEQVEQGALTAGALLLLATGTIATMLWAVAVPAGLVTAHAVLYKPPTTSVPGTTFIRRVATEVLRKTE